MSGTSIIAQISTSLNKYEFKLVATLNCCSNLIEIYILYKIPLENVETVLFDG